MRQADQDLMDATTNNQSRSLDRNLAEISSGPTTSAAQPPTIECRYLDCWCREWPPIRLVVSIELRYTMKEIEPNVFVFDYLPPTIG